MSMFKKTLMLGTKKTYSESVPKRESQSPIFFLGHFQGKFFLYLALLDFQQWFPGHNSIECQIRKPKQMHKEITRAYICWEKVANNWGKKSPKERKGKEKADQKKKKGKQKGKPLTQVPPPLAKEMATDPMAVQTQQVMMGGGP